MSANEDIFDRIRAAAAEVAQQAKFVHLVDAQIAPYAASLVADGLPTPVYDTVNHARGSVAETVAFLLTLDTVNFGSGYFPHRASVPACRGITPWRHHSKSAGSATAHSPGPTCAR
jgi:hypothetical protein